MDRTGIQVVRAFQGLQVFMQCFVGSVASFFRLILCQLITENTRRDNVNERNGLKAEIHQRFTHIGDADASIVIDIHRIRTRIGTFLDAAATLLPKKQENGHWFVEFTGKPTKYPHTPHAHR